MTLTMGFDGERGPRALLDALDILLQAHAGVVLERDDLDNLAARLVASRVVRVTARVRNNARVSYRLAGLPGRRGRGMGNRMVPVDRGQIGPGHARCGDLEQVSLVIRED